MLEAKSTSVTLSSGETQGRRYADQLRVPYIFLAQRLEATARALDDAAAKAEAMAAALSAEAFG